MQFNAPVLGHAGIATLWQPENAFAMSSNRQDINVIERWRRLRRDDGVCKEEGISRRHLGPADLWVCLAGDNLSLDHRGLIDVVSIARGGV